MKNTYSIIITFAIAIASIYFFYQLNFAIAVLLLTWLISRLLGYTLTDLFEGVNRLRVEEKSNIQIELWFNVAEILNHKIFEDVFKKIRDSKEEDTILFRETKEWKEKLKNKNIADISKEWKNKLIENYKKKYNNSTDFDSDNVRYVWEKVKFNIKNNTLWKDDKIFFGDTIIHQISIPYEHKGEDEYYGFSDFPNRVDIRILLVNGNLKLQVGTFAKGTTPKFIRKEGLAIYQTYFTIATFPLMYAQFGIPANYLNLRYEATDSYWDSMGKSGNVKTDDWIKEWKIINKEVKDYQYLNRFDIDSSLDKKATSIMSDFRKKLSEWRKSNQDFKSNEDKIEDGEYVPDFLRDDHMEYVNKYFRISLLDYEMFKENKGRYEFSDYWEEHP